MKGAVILNEIFSDALRRRASAAHDRDRGFGRRVEADRSWTVYHVFTGDPGFLGGLLLTGLDRAGATENMLTLNRDAVASHLCAISLPSASPSWL